MSTVVVLNTTYEPIHTTSVKHAIGMLWRGVAVAINEDQRELCAKRVIELRTHM